VVAEAERTVTLFSLLPFVAGLLSLLLAVLSVLRKKPSIATWSFFGGMVALGVDSILTGFSLREARLEDALSWLKAGFVVKSVIPGIWLCFSLTYSRVNYREFLARWRMPLAIVGVVPVGLTIGFWNQLLQLSAPATFDAVQFQPGLIARVLNLLLLVALVLIAINLEQTFRSAVGTARWRIKFVVLGLAVIFGAQLYVRSQAILYSVPDITLWGVEAGGLLIGCLFLALAYVRTGWAEVDLHPSSAVLRSSITVLIVGGYLFIVGILAQLVRRLGGAESFQLQSFVILAGMAGLAVFLLSDRARQKVQSFSRRHFKKAQHDSVRIWAECSRRLATVTDEASLSAVAARFVSETFDTLSVTVWLIDADKEALVARASTASQRVVAAGADRLDAASSTVIAGLQARSSPCDLDEVRDAWAAEFRQVNPTTFLKGGNRLCVPLRGGDHVFGALVLADRIRGVPYSAEELDLLKCLGDQLTSVLLNLLLAGEVARAKELDAFRTVSAFFVHDLKNAAASLNLMLKNLPVHFDDPAFRQDALRGIGNTARRIDEMITRLSALRQRPDLRRVQADLNQLVSEALDRVDSVPEVELERELQPLPRIFADPEQIQSVVTNLVQNARDALGPGGRIHVRTERSGARAVLSIADNGCGMTPAFLRESLFRPFQSTKKKGLGIGLFQSRAIVLAHGGGMQVQSEVGKGTTIFATFPVVDEP
jgi:putative PEP-CTERM system histidine kinase